MRTLAELAKEGANATAEGDMVDAVVRSGAVEAIVPLLSLSQRVGEEFDVSFGDIEKEASYAISLMASRDVNQNRIAKAGALPGLVALLQRYPPQTTGSVPTSVARRAADAVTNLAHENNGIKNQTRVEGGIPPLVSLLETKDPKVKRAAASALRTLAFKNDDNKNQIVECGALPMLIFMVKSEDQLIHYEAVGVIGNLVHSSTHIKRRVLDEGALQPVIGLLSSACPESQREAALLLDIPVELRPCPGARAGFAAELPHVAWGNSPNSRATACTPAPSSRPSASTPPSEPPPRSTLAPS